MLQCYIEPTITRHTFMVGMAWMFLTSMSRASEPATESATSKKLPVILLTGFEPFGPNRSPNSSWEGVKRLDGKQWKGFQLVAKQLPVVWGAPLEKLAPWMDELHPVAVFSFGQGRHHTLETVADNRRGRETDNNGEYPSRVSIVADGPDKVKATIDSIGLTKLLSARGRKVEISVEAGNYLCEECLYTLEHLKTIKKLEKTTVLFCHIPPLSKKFEAADAEQFMRDVLDSWHALNSRETLPTKESK